MASSGIRPRWAALRLSLFTLVIALAPVNASQDPSWLDISKSANGFSLSLPGFGNFRTTTREIQNARVIDVPGSRARLVLWEEKQADGKTTPFYAISPDGARLARAQATSYELLLRYERFDPLVGQPVVPEALASQETDNNAENVYIVQFVTQPLEEFRKQIRQLGGVIYKYLARHAYLVKMTPDVRFQVEMLPFVRWVGPYHPAYRLEESFVQLTKNSLWLPPMRCNIQLFERGDAQQNQVARRIEELGGAVHLTNSEGFRLEATMDADGIRQVAQMPQVQFIDRWSPPEDDVTTAREIGGANYLEMVTGFTGEGVRGEVLDGGVRQTHQEFGSRPLIVHGQPPGIASHGTSTTGIIFGDGAIEPRGRGLLPSGQGITATYNGLTNRYQHTAELLQDPFFAVFQSNSWGSALTTQYTTISAEMDDIILHHDIVILQSQSNTGNQLSRPQAWAKNIVSIGGVLHRGSLDMDTHCWCRSGSIGPAADGRIKPDLAHFYDLNFTSTSTSDSSYTSSFGGTSAATPIVAGHFGLFFQMWHNGLFGNPTGKTVFDSRPHAATAKAMVINTARQWNFSGVDDDRTRTHVGWGLPDLQSLYDNRSRIFVVDQTDVLQNLEVKTYTVNVADGSDFLRATMIYEDPPGTTSSTLHRINDLDLRVTAPSGVVYWGNNGLYANMWSLPDGDADTINTVENVFVQNPEAGTWTVEVIATEINEDEHLETPEIDSDFALVVSGVVRDLGSAVSPKATSRSNK